MTETLQTPASIVRDQLAEVLVVVPESFVASLTQRELFNVLDWVETVRDQVASQAHVTVCDLKSIRNHMNADQLAGDWTAFTTWRPNVKQKQQATMFE